MVFSKLSPPSFLAPPINRSCFRYLRSTQSRPTHNSNARRCSEEKKLEELSSLGHFLKGSSATLGLVKIRDGCESIQRYGKMENTDGSPLPDADKCLKLIDETLQAVKKDFAFANTVLRQHYPADA